MVCGGTTFLCVVDPGVGGARPPVILEADGRWYVARATACWSWIERRAATARSWDIDLKPRRLSRAFTAATCSRQSQPCWRAASRPQAGRARTMRIAEETGPTTSPKSSTSTISANAMTG